MIRIALALIIIATATITTINVHSMTIVKPLDKILNMLTIATAKNCTIVSISNTLPTKLIVKLSCTSPMENTFLKDNNCTYVEGTRYEYKCVWDFEPAYTVKASTTLYKNYPIYVVETHIRTLGTITSHPAISATSIISCSESSPRCSIMVYGLTNVKNVIVITSNKVKFLFCEGLDLFKKYDLGTYTVYVFHVSSSTKLMYSSRGIFFSSCAVLTEDELTREMFISNLSLGVAAGIAAGLAAFLIASYIILRRH